MKDSRQGFSVHSGCPETLSVDQISLKLRDSPVFDSQVLELKVCVIIIWQGWVFIYKDKHALGMGLKRKYL